MLGLVTEIPGTAYTAHFVLDVDDATIREKALEHLSGFDTGDLDDALRFSWADNPEAAVGRLLAVAVEIGLRAVFPDAGILVTGAGRS